MVDMKRTPAEKAEDKVEMDEYTGPDYPYGLCIYLDEDSLEKLGKGIEDFDIGDVVEIKAKAYVKSLSKSQREGSEGHESVDLQISDMELMEPKKSDSERAATMYGADD